MEYFNKITLSDIVVGVIMLVIGVLGLRTSLYSITTLSTLAVVLLSSYIIIAKYISFISLRNRENSQHEKINFLLDDEEVDKEASLVIISIAAYIYFLDASQGLTIEKAFYDLSNYFLLSAVISFELFMYSLLSYFFKFSKKIKILDSEKDRDGIDLMGYERNYHCLNLQNKKVKEKVPEPNRGVIMPILFFINVSKTILSVIAIFVFLKIFQVPGADQIGAIFASTGGSLAVLAFVFREGFKSILAGIRIWMDDLVEIGDDVKPPKPGIKGKVIDITLTNIKIKNVDNTIANLTLEKFINGDFLNCSQFKSYGRRFSFVICIDKKTIKRIDNSGENQEILARINEIEILKEYLECKADSIDKFNDGSNSSLNNRGQTNIGIFRAYIREYLIRHPFINNENTILVRHLSPDSNQGLQVSIIAHVKKDYVSVDIFRAIESDIIEHVLSNVKVFDLQVHQIENAYQSRIV